MLIPIGTNVLHRRQPFVTYLIIGLNLLIFALYWAVERSGGGGSQNELMRSIADMKIQGGVSSANFHYWSLLTYQFVHDDWLHIIFNMIFLLPFGKTVEDRMGHLFFALFYLGCGAISAYIYILSYSNALVIGASGSVCAVVAAFIVIAPKTKVHVLFIFFIIGVYAVPSILLITFFVLVDTFNLLTNLLSVNPSRTAWVVHLVGYASGFIFTFLALSFGLIKSSEFDLQMMIRQYRRRKIMKKCIVASPVFNENNDSVQNQESAIRLEISEEAHRGSIEKASSMYFKAIEEQPSLKIDRRTHHLIGSTLLQHNKTKAGVEVFERYLVEHKEAKDCPEIALLLAAKYARNLDNSKRASELLSTYADKFSDNHKALAKTIESELKA